MVAAALSLAACKTSPTITQDAPVSPSAKAGASAEVNANANASADASANAKADASTDGIRVVMVAQDADALSTVRTERLRAKADGRVLVVYAGAGWCEPCKRFKHAVETGSLDAKLPKLTLLVFDADRDTDRLGAAGYKFQFIPYVALPGADGHPTDSAEARTKGSESWRELIGKLETWQGR